MKLATRYRCSSDAFVSCVRGEGAPQRRKCPTCGSALRIEQGAHGIYVWRGDGRYFPRDAVEVFSTASAADRFANDHLADGYVVRWIGSEDVPAALPDRRSTAVSNCQLTAEQWRVISYLYQPYEAKRLNGATVSSVMRKQVVGFDAITAVVDLGYVEARIGGQALDRSVVERLAIAPKTAHTKVRLRTTPTGDTRAGTDPQHLVLCTLGICDRSLEFLLRHVPISFDQLCDLADRRLIDTRLKDGGADISIQDVRRCPELAYACRTNRGRTFVAYL